MVLSAISKPAETNHLYYYPDNRYGYDNIALSCRRCPRPGTDAAPPLARSAKSFKIRYYRLSPVLRAKSPAKSFRISSYEKPGGGPLGVPIDLKRAGSCLCPERDSPRGTGIGTKDKAKYPMTSGVGVLRQRSAIGLAAGLFVAGTVACAAYANDAPVAPLTAEQVVQRMVERKVRSGSAEW